MGVWELTVGQRDGLSRSTRRSAPTPRPFAGACSSPAGHGAAAVRSCSWGLRVGVHPDTGGPSSHPAPTRPRVAARFLWPSSPQGRGGGSRTGTRRLVHPLQARCFLLRGPSVEHTEALAGLPLPLPSGTEG